MKFHHLILMTLLLGFRWTDAQNIPKELAWIAPMPYQNPAEVQTEPAYAFVKGAMLRKDFLSLFEKLETWPKVRQQTAVFKFYIGVLYQRDYPNYPSFGTTDADLKKMIQLLKSQGIKTAFEIGGIRPPFLDCQDLISPTFEAETKHLQRWLNLGGQIDFLVFDHPIGFTLQSQKWNLTSSGTPVPVVGNCARTFDEIVSEAVRSMQMTQKFVKEFSPQVKIGLIESLGYYTFQAQDRWGGTYSYLTTAPDRYPKFEFRRLLDDLLLESEKRGFSLDHFGLDFNDAFFVDAQQYGNRSRALNQGKALPARDYGRLFSAIEELEKRKIPIAYIANAFGKDSAEVEKRTLTFYQEIKDRHPRFDHEVFQFWHAIPKLTLPEEEAGTAMSIFLNLFKIKK